MSPVRSRQGAEDRRGSSNRTRRASPGAGAPLSARLTCPIVPHARVLGGHRGKSGQQRGGLAGGAERIWPVDELLGIFPDYVLFPKEEE